MAATTEMRATMTFAVTTATVTATFRSGIPSSRQHGRESNYGNPDMEFWHGPLTLRCATNPRHVRRTLAW
jgi:hypothetical protein